MTRSDILPAWGRVLRGSRPLLSIEITKECPLRCPGCYAYESDHVSRGIGLRQLGDYRGQELVDRVLKLVKRYQPLHLSIVGGEPLVRCRELDDLLPALDAMGIEVQLVTSAVRDIPSRWRKLAGLHIVVSIDGLQPDHDRRRSPATYARILENISGHEIVTHCTITRQLLARPGYLSEFCEFWSARSEARKIWFSLFTPQENQSCPERLTAEGRVRAVSEIAQLRTRYAKVDMPRAVLDGFLRPPASPRECIFAQVTACISADLATTISPCQFGGRPVCSECGCIASAGLAAIGRHKLVGIVPVSTIFALSRNIGSCVGARTLMKAERNASSAGISRPERSGLTAVWPRASSILKRD
jgi:organic radical activating enzyme